MAITEPEVSLDYSLSGATANAGWTPAVVDVTPPGEEAEDINTSYQETTTAHTHKAADLWDPGQLTVTFFYDPTDMPVVGAANEVWTLTFPDDTAKTFNGYVQSFSPDSHTLNGAMLATAVIQMSGDWVS